MSERLTHVRAKHSSIFCRCMAPILGALSWKLWIRSCGNSNDVVHIICNLLNHALFSNTSHEHAQINRVHRGSSFLIRSSNVASAPELSKAERPVCGPLSRCFIDALGRIFSGSGSCLPEAIQCNPEEFG